MRVVSVVSGKLTEVGVALDEALGGVLSGALKRSRFRGEEGERLVLFHEDGFVVLLGVGGRRGLDPDRVRRAGARVARLAGELGVREVAVENFFADRLGREEASYALAQGLALGAYRFDRYRSGAKEPRLRFWIHRGRRAPLEEAGVMSRATWRVRDLVNEPPNVLGPGEFAARARELAEGAGVEFRELGREEMEELGMGALLAVARGAERPPRLLHLVYRPEKPRRRVALVGKGLCFDTGGYSLKPTEGMRGMKADMAGAAVVLAAVLAAAELGLPLEVHGVMPLLENRISGGAYVVDEVVRTMSGKTVEVKNTDAEGRLVLADALYYAGQEAPDAVVSVATLTGSARIALGDRVGALFATDARLGEAVRRAGEREGEPLWPLPLFAGYRELLKSQVADISNVGTRAGGAIQAALFLAEFVRDPFVHLDIAGPSFLSSDWELGPAGATGFGVRSLVRWLAEL